jgi:hypothetical protein
MSTENKRQGLLCPRGVRQKERTVQAILLNGRAAIHGGIEQKVDTRGELPLAALTDGIVALGRADAVNA